MGILGSIFGGLIEPVKDIVSEVVVDKDKARELNVRLQELADQADARYHEEVMGQLEINKEEAKHASIFVAGWRPAVGWIGAAGLGLAAIVLPFLNWVAMVVFNYGGPIPKFDTDLLIFVLSGILGLGGMRTYEKKHGISDTIKKKDG